MSPFWRRKKEEEQLERMVKHAAELHGVSTKDVVDVMLEEDEDEDYERGSRKGVWVTFAVVGVMFGLGIIFIMRFVNGAVESGPEASKVLGEAKASVQPTPTAAPSLTGLKVAFSYPKEFDSVSRVRNATGIEQYMLTSTNETQSKVAVVVDELPTGKLEDDSGYGLRNMKTAPYKKTASKVGNEPVVVMVKSDGSERTMYWVHRDMVLIISATGSIGGRDLEQFLTEIANSMRWLG